MIAFVIPNIYPCTTGGMEIFYFHLIQDISKRQKVIILTNCKNFKSTANIKVVYINDRIFYIRRFGLSALSLILSLYFQIYRYRKYISIVHVALTSSSGYYGAVFPFIKKFLGIRYVSTSHGGGLKEWSKLSLYPLFFKYADTRIAVSTIIKNELQKRTGKSFDVILPLVPYTYCEKSKENLRRLYNIQQDAKVIIMVGSLKIMKGCYFVVKSIHSLGSKYLSSHNINLVLAGIGEDEENIINYIHQNGLQEYIRLLGPIPNEKVHEIFCLADYYIIASEFEGTSKSMLEAMFHGLPILASDVRGINNVIDNNVNGMLFKFNDQDSFLSGMMYLIENKEHSMKIGNCAKQHYEERYSFESTVNYYISILNLV